MSARSAFAHDARAGCVSAWSCDPVARVWSVCKESVPLLGYAVVILRWTLFSTPLLVLGSQGWTALTTVDPTTVDCVCRL